MIKKIAAFATLISGLAIAQSNYVLDKSHSRIGFEISHLAISSVDGNFKDYQGTIVWDDKDLSKSKMNVTIQAASINTDADKRDEHLRAPDFFDVAKYNTIQFQSSKITSQGGNKYLAQGALTLRGVTKNVQIPFTMAGPIQNPYKQTLRAFKGSFTINRLDYQIGSAIPAAVVGNEVTISITAEAIQQ